MSNPGKSFIPFLLYDENAVLVGVGVCSDEKFCTGGLVVVVFNSVAFVSPLLPPFKKD